MQQNLENYFGKFNIVKLFNFPIEEFIRLLRRDRAGAQGTTVFLSLLFLFPSPCRNTSGARSAARRATLPMRVSPRQGEAPGLLVQEGTAILATTEDLAARSSLPGPSSPPQQVQELLRGAPPGSPRLGAALPRPGRGNSPGRARRTGCWQSSRSRSRTPAAGV